MTEIVYVILCTDDPDNPNGDTWVQTIFRENLTAETVCAKLNSEAKYAEEYYIEEHEVVDG